MRYLLISYTVLCLSIAILQTSLVLQTSKTYSLQREIFDILYFIWQRNIDIAWDQYWIEANDIQEIEDVGIIDKSYMDIQDPKLKAVFQAVNYDIYSEYEIMKKMQSVISKRNINTDISTNSGTDESPSSL